MKGVVLGVVAFAFLQAGMTANAQIQGRVVEEEAGKFVFQSADPAVQSVPLEIDAAKASRLSRLPLISTTEGDPHQVSELLAKDAAQLSSVTKFREVENVFRASRFDSVKRAFQKLETEVGRTLQLGEMSAADSRDVIRSQEIKAAAEVSKAVLDTLEANDGTLEQIIGLQELIEQIEEEIKGLEPPISDELAELSAVEKTLYVGGREYSPGVYRRIAINTQGSVGLKIVPGSDKVYCSGAVIGEDLILTARHCLFNLIAEEVIQIPINKIRVVFDFETGINRKEKRIESVIAMGDRSADPAKDLDFAVLKVSDIPPPSVVLMVEDGIVRPSERKVCMTTANLQREEEIYVVGHPKEQSRTVADNGQVLFPYIVSEEVLGLLHLSVLKELRVEAGSDDATSERIFELLRRWTDSYKDQGDGMYLHNSRAFHGRPTLGIQSNTYGGSSGGPVFSKVYNRLVGVFRSGEFDGKALLEGGWENHESALPIELVITDMTQRQSDWMEIHKVCAWGKDGDFESLWSDNSDLLEHCTTVCI